MIHRPHTGARSQGLRALDRSCRERTYFAYFRVGRRSLGPAYREFLKYDRDGSSDDLADARLGEMLSHAAAKVPYYSALLRDAGGDIERDPVAALKALPLLSKALIREHFDDLCSSDLDQRKTYVKASGGSTGEPVQLIQDMHFRDYDNAVQMLMSTWAGWRPAEREVVIVGSEADILESSVAFQSRVANHLMRRTYFNAFQMTAGTTADCLAELDRDPPRLIRGYSQSIDDLATFAQREGISVAPQNAILGTAGMLYPSMRERIEAVFDCPVFNQYGSREVSAIGCECEHRQGLHVFPWMNFVEIVDDEDNPVEPGEEGRVIVTSLCNFAMPLIRYEIGDRAAMTPEDAAPCPCGRPGPRIARVLGRTVDTFKALDGTAVHGAFFTTLLWDLDSIKRFQVIQPASDLVVFRLEAIGAVSDDSLRKIREGAQAAIGDGCRVEFEFVDEIRPSPSGKYLYTICEI